MPLLIPEGAGGWSLKRSEDGVGSADGVRGGLGGLPTPMLVLPAVLLSSTLLLLPFEVAARFWPFCILFIICPNCAHVWLFLVPFSFFLSLKRRFFRCEHYSKSSQISLPGSLFAIVKGIWGIKFSLWLVYLNKGVFFFCILT